jgi:hypothetical protein
MKHTIPAGAVYGAWTVLGPADPEVQGTHVFVRAECWSCKERYDVRADNLVNGTSKRCGPCSRAWRKGSGRNPSAMPTGGGNWGGVLGGLTELSELSEIEVLE